MNNIKEGALYKTLCVDGERFDIFYGYYSEAEKAIWEPTPIYPRFTDNPIYTKDGRPYVRADQDICEHYKPKDRVSGEDWCNDCRHYRSGEELIGVCTAEEKRSIFRQNE